MVRWMPYIACATTDLHNPSACRFCFHTDTSSKTVPIEDAKRGLKLLADAGMKKINISGGEPFLRPTFIGEIIQYCKEELKLESTGIICNASKVTLQWLDKYGRYLDIMGVSCDSFDDETNFKIGRSEKGKGVHTRKVFQVAESVVYTNLSVTAHRHIFWILQVVS
jgi:radical S-adenosyl methionine domain-containing protein 2